MGRLGSGLILTVGLMGVFTLGCAPPTAWHPVIDQVQAEEIPEVDPQVDEPEIELVSEQDPAPTDVTELEGQEGSLRFHLKFDNEMEVDLDLHVLEPSGEEIHYAYPLSSNKGELDVDCKCGHCPQGPSENIFWPDDVYMPGTYTYWVNYFTGCDSFGAASSYTLYVIVDDEVARIHEGTLVGFPTARFEFELP